jgi:serine/threonine-protein kinase HipA
MSSLNVFFEDILVGKLSQSEDLTYSFVYSEKWLGFKNQFPLSLAMPLQAEAFGNRVTLSFFENLLPEGDVRDAVAKSNHVGSPYEFLKEHGEDCAGAIIVSGQDESPYKPDRLQKKVPIDMDLIYQAIANHHSVAQVISELNPGYLSLAGAQDKFPAIFKDQQFFLPTDAAPTSHIVKVPIHRQGVKESVFNEYYCMQLAGLCGFQIPQNQVVHDGKFPLFVIERYDRSQEVNGVLRRIHQQDFCQAQGVTSERKYEAKGGPSIKNNYDLIVTNVTYKERPRSTYAFLDWICFNLLIGNNDSHSKNISFLMKDGKIELAPIYDLVSTALYASLKKTFSFKIGGRDDYSQIGKDELETLDQELGLKLGTMEERIGLTYRKMASHKDDLALQISDTFNGVKIVKRIAELIGDRARDFQQQGLHL